MAEKGPKNFSRFLRQLLTTTYIDVIQVIVNPLNNVLLAVIQNRQLIILVDYLSYYLLQCEIFLCVFLLFDIRVSLSIM